MDLLQQYGELIAALKQHIKEEHACGSWIGSGQDTFEYFKQHAIVQSTKARAHALAAPSAAKRAVPANALARDSSAPPSARPKEQICAPVEAPKTVAAPISPGISPEENHSISAAEPPSPPPELSKANKNAPSQAKNQAKKKTFERELPSPPIESDLSDIKQFFAKTFPHIQLQENPPPDEAAKAYSSRWKLPANDTKVLILSFGANPKEKLFLSNLTHAIDVEMGKAALFSAEKGELQGCWKELLQYKNLTLVIAHKGKMETLPGLMALYREEPSPMLDKIPFYPLCDSSLYIQEPALKIELWKALFHMQRKHF